MLNSKTSSVQGEHNFILGQWKDVNQCRLAVGSLNWREHVCRVSAHWVPLAKGNMIALQAYSNEVQALRSSSVMNSFWSFSKRFKEHKSVCLIFYSSGELHELNSRNPFKAYSFKESGWLMKKIVITTINQSEYWCIFFVFSHGLFILSL